MKPALYHYFELLSLIVSIICLPRTRRSYFTWFIPFLSITLAAELYANYAFYIKHLPTVWIYNVLNPVAQAFYTYIFYKFARSNSHKIFLVACGIIYVGAYIFYYTIYDVNDFSTYLIVIGGIQQVVFACLFFYECLRTDATMDGRMRSGVWMAAGVLIFYSGVTICLALLDFIEKNNLKIAGVPLYNFIPRVLSIILYSCFSVSFIIWGKSMTSK